MAGGAGLKFRFYVYLYKKFTLLAVKFLELAYGEPIILDKPTAKLTVEDVEKMPSEVYRQRFTDPCFRIIVDELYRSKK